MSDVNELNTSSMPAAGKKKRYCRPRLTLFGGITELTLGANPNIRNDPMGAANGKSK